MKAVWAEFYDNRNGVKPKIVRRLQLEKLLQLIQEIYDHRWIYEEDRNDFNFSLSDTEEFVPNRFVVGIETVSRASLLIKLSGLFLRFYERKIPDSRGLPESDP
jgi:hypothetical protein